MQKLFLMSFMLKKISLKPNVGTDESNGWNEMWTLDKEMKLE